MVSFQPASKWLQNALLEPRIFLRKKKREMCTVHDEYLDLHLSVSVPDPDDSYVSRRHEEARLLLPVDHHTCTYDAR